MTTSLIIPCIFGLSIEVYFILIIIGVPTFFFWKWLFKKYVKVARTRKKAVWLATLLATPLIYGGLIMLLMFAITYTPSKNFDKSQWLTDREGRFQMANDIIESKMLIGIDTNQLKEILGNPTLGGDTTQVWIYDMGFGGGGLGFLFHKLDLNIDNKGKVSSVEHVKISD